MNIEGERRASNCTFCDGSAKLPVKVAALQMCRRDKRDST
jgi:prepilin-type processing-associated H-X9-DG protein